MKSPTQRIALAYTLAVLRLWCGPDPALAAVDFESVASGFVRPLGVIHAGDASDRLFVLEQAGRVRVISNGEVLARSFLDISEQTTCCGGRGLMAMAFHPNFEDNGFFYLYYTDKEGAPTLSRFRVSASDPNRARAGSEREVLRLDLPPGQHIGGGLAFGPEGFLYLSVGDGSAGGDPENNAQNLASPYGKILRLDIDNLPGAIPADNPFVDQPSARPEVWASGLRNPWRISFDRLSGDMFVGDVGQEQREEIDFEAAGSAGGQNYGWRLKEGTLCFEPDTECDQEALTAPIIEYGHQLGCSVTGGYRYRGSRAATLGGHYIFGDFCSGRVWGSSPNRNGVWITRQLGVTGFPIVSFGEDEAGEILVVDFGGTVYRMASRELFASGFESGNFSGWKKTGSVRITEPGLAGSGFAFEVSAGSEPVFVSRRIRGRESSLEAGVVLDLKDWQFPAGAADVVQLRDVAGSHLWLVVKQASPRRFRVELRVMDAQRGERLVARTTFKRKNEVTLGIEWRASSSPGSRDGLARLLKNGKKRGVVTDLATADQQVKTIAIGLPEGVASGSSGSLLVDGFTLSRGRE